MKVIIDLKIVLDTNVFVSGVFFKGPPFQILDSWKSGKFQIVISKEILDEYQRVGEVLAEDHPDIDLKPILKFVIEHATVYETKPLKESVCEDPDDDKFIACAISSDSKIIVSGDKHLLKVSGYQGIEVIKPKEFTDRYLKE